MRPSEKSPQVEQALREMFGVDRRQAIMADRCISPPIGCGEFLDAQSFRDETSRREFRISGLCQKCQDAVYGGDDE